MHLSVLKKHCGSPPCFESCKCGPTPPGSLVKVYIFCQDAVLGAGLSRGLACQLPRFVWQCHLLQLTDLLSHLGEQIHIWNIVFWRILSLLLRPCQLTNVASQYNVPNNNTDHHIYINWIYLIQEDVCFMMSCFNRSKGERHPTLVTLCWRFSNEDLGSSFSKIDFPPKMSTMSSPALCSSSERLKVTFLWPSVDWHPSASLDT